jgi:hypothetical protein
VKYRAGYKYSLWEDYTFQTRINGYSFEHRLFMMRPDGTVTVFADYPWDGASGPTWDTKSSMRASLEHDVLYEMMRLGLLPQSCFLMANFQLYHTAIADGMWAWRANSWLKALNRFGHAACKPKEENVLEAP